MTIIGNDRPGLVEAVASIVVAHEGNWLESRMAHLGGQFAGILRVEVPESQIGPLTRALERAGSEGLSVETVFDDPPKNPVPAGNLALLEIVGQDRPGIVRDISKALAQAGVNVEELQSECSSAAMSGETLFKARAHLLLPRNHSLETLRASLEKIAADLIVEVTLEPLASKPA